MQKLSISRLGIASGCELGNTSLDARDNCVYVAILREEATVEASLNCQEERILSRA